MRSHRDFSLMILALYSIDDRLLRGEFGVGDLKRAELDNLHEAAGLRSQPS
jgi:hypothetical protein